MLTWCERQNVKYVVGIGKNNRLLKQTEGLRKQAEKTYEDIHEDQRLFGEIQYAVETWSRSRRIIIKVEHTSNGTNPRFVVTNLLDKPQPLYECDIVSEETVKIESKNNFNYFQIAPVVISGGRINFDYCFQAPLTF